MYNPVSTYRLQFNKDFTFQHAEELVEYLSHIGVRTLYASPIFAAVPGSPHGYDVVNPFAINPEIGTEEQLRSLAGKLQACGIGWIQDIVPNHMAYHPGNPWLMDAMEKGFLSPYAQVFDTTWSGDFHTARPMAPFLNAPLEEVIERGELHVAYHHNRICLRYGDLYFPLNSRSYGELLNVPGVPSSIAAFVTQLEDLHRIDDPVQYTLRWHELLLQFSSLIQDASTADLVENVLQETSADYNAMSKIAGNQFYRMCDWRETDERINYRRFFLVNGLICLNMHVEKVFALYHERLAAFVREGIFQGIRVDHIDGLFDPVTYLKRLRELCGPSCYIVVEKILEHGEQLDVTWPIQGTTGYEFLSAVNNLFTRSSAENRFSKFYQSLTHDESSIAEKILDKKRYILDHHMQGELSNLTTYFLEHLLSTEQGPIQHLDRAIKKGETKAIRDAITMLLVEMPVYRYYGNHLPLEPAEHESINKLLSRCASKRKDLSPVFALIGAQWLAESPSPHALNFYQRCMQYSGPLMAKGVEDTLMYTYNRFVGHNEVGDSPEFFGLSTEDFHESMRERQRHWPLAMNATSTHDTKRGEDVRMRLNVLPDVADAWIRQVKSWMEINRVFKTNGAPDDNDEYFIYQNLVGVYDPRDGTLLADRLKAFMSKAMREAKRHSSWSEPNEAYETATSSFLDAILASSEFMVSFTPFCRHVTDFGMINSFSQLVLKGTCPGVPDIYQGTADWDLSLVDPDNRRPVDFERQMRDLDDVKDFKTAWSTRDNGAVKGWTLQRLLHIRHIHELIFRDGQYISLETEGRRAAHCLAFARQLGRKWIVVAIPLNSARFMQSAGEWSAHWDDTNILLPPHAPFSGRQLLSEVDVQHRGMLKVSSLFADFPFAILLLEEENTQREAGVVLAVSSLPGPHGVGDFGPSARQFADFLHASRQRVWQILPINPAHGSAAYSPYSSYSAMAGSIVYISPEDLVNDGLLEPSMPFRIHKAGRADYEVAVQDKTLILKQAYDNFQRGSFTELTREYNQFAEAEAFWLRDYALFEILREQHHDAPWHQWPAPLRDRKQEALESVAVQFEDAISWVMWTQFIFDRQWKLLQKYCHDRGIRLMGDLPFYVDHDSADVWAHRDLFSVSSEGSLLAMAGVPPDYFSADGQLWGMPVYNWGVMREDNYAWFLSRVRRNLAYFDILRLDHFRAFATYWEVEAGQSTARQGSWREGPGQALFEALKRVRGQRSELVAEDLGDIGPDVYALRDSLQLPGMHVLQFAFGENIASTIHSPHHHRRHSLVYTGTHDNNTTKGWYRKELDAASRARLAKYVGKRVTPMNVARVLVNLAYGSVADTAMIPMQDLLNLNERNRLNTPATVNALNWRWRLTEIPGQDEAERLCELA
ncbi:MAG TPA: malto-oligosyltrehalose synthase, partial [Chryseolinea sp.]|nr:malto-oligosyltrehalose synthase [Chryseolinea sp.]